MVIGIDASRANKSYKTGTEWYSFYLIKNFARIDKKNQYILYTLEPPAQGLLNLGPNFKHQVLPWPPRRLWTQIRFSAHLLKDSPAILFVPAHTIPLIHPQTVTTCHDLGFERYPKLYSRSERLYQLWSLKYALKKADKIIAVSDFTKRELIDLHKIPEDKITVIHHGYNKEIFRPVDKQLAQAAAQRYDLRPNQYLIYIGRIEAKKNIVGLVKAFSLLKKEKKLKDLQLTLVGTQGFQFQKINKYVASLGLTNEVKILGWVPLVDLPYLLTASAAFVFPSFYEGFGIPILEAMACQALILASHLPPIEEVAGDSVIYFDPHNPYDMAEVIYSALSEKENLRQKLFSKWQETVDGYSWEKSAHQTLILLKNI